MRGNRISAPYRCVTRAFPLLAALLLCGCPYSAEEPLSDPLTAVIDPALVGAWRMRDGETGEWQILVFVPFNERELVAYAPVEAPGETSLCRVFTTMIGGERFLNVRELGMDGEQWYYAHYTVDGDRCILWLIDDYLFDSLTFRSAGDRRQFIQAHLADPLLYAAEGSEPSEMTMERAAE